MQMYEQNFRYLLVIYKKLLFTIEIFFVLVYNNRYIGILCPDVFYR